MELRRRAVALRILDWAAEPIGVKVGTAIRDRWSARAVIPKGSVGNEGSSLLGSTPLPQKQMLGLIVEASTWLILREILNCGR